MRSPVYDGLAMTQPDPAQAPPETPVEPVFTHPASPFLRTEVPTPAFAARPIHPQVASTWVLYRAQIEFGLVVLAYLMVLVGCLTVVQANPNADWRYYVAAIPVAPAALLIWLFVRALGRLDELQKRVQLQAFGFATGTTGVLTFGYGFLEGTGVPHLNWVFVMPLMGILWGVGTLALEMRYRYRR